MKPILRLLIIGLGLTFFLTAPAIAAELSSAEAALEDVDAVGALALANEWRWTLKDIQSYVDTREVVFKFPNGAIKKIPLPADKMVVAVAPYQRQTHR